MPAARGELPEIPDEKPTRADHEQNHHSEEEDGNTLDEDQGRLELEHYFDLSKGQDPGDSPDLFQSDAVQDVEEEVFPSGVVSEVPDASSEELAADLESDGQSDDDYFNSTSQKQPLHGAQTRNC